MSESFFEKSGGPAPSNFIKKDSPTHVFPVNFANFKNIFL